MHHQPDWPHDDLCLVAETLITTARGNVPIRDVRVGDYALTRQGFKRVLCAGVTQKSVDVVTVYTSDGNSITGTRNHPIYTSENGFMRLDSSSGYCIMTVWQNQKQLPIRGLFSDAILSRKTRRIATIFDRTLATFATALDICIKRFGRMRTAQYQKVTRFITGMETHLTTTSTTLSVLPSLSIDDANLNSGAGRLARQGVHTWRKSGHLPKNGTSLLRDASGIPSTASARGKAESLKHMSVPIVARNSSHLRREEGTVRGQSSALDCVQNESGQRPEGDSRKSSVQFAGRLFWDKPNRKTARVRVVHVQDGTEKRDVYNISVEGAQEYFANGILVHNCDASSGAFNAVAGAGQGDVAVLAQAFNFLG
jgi:hypothetical protein